jgi:hypothetical protein
VVWRRRKIAAVPTTAPACPVAGRGGRAGPRALRVVCELRQPVLVQVDPRHPGPPKAGLPPSPPRLSLAAGPLADTALSLEVQSISPAGLAVFSAPCTPNQVDASVLQDPPEGEALTFVLEKDGQSMTLQASLVWVELSTEQRLELIVDTGDQPGWLEVQSALVAG